MTSGEIVETVDVSDICQNVDEVVIFDNDGRCYYPRAFVEDDAGSMSETLVNLSNYPAVVTVCRYAFDVDGCLVFDSVPPADCRDSLRV